MREINVVRHMVYGEPLKDVDLEDASDNQTGSKVERK